MGLIILLLSSMLLAGCAEMGNRAIKTASAEDLQGKTEAQLVAQFGPPTVRTVMFADGKTRETLAWSYMLIAPFSTNLASLYVTLDETKTVVAVTTKDMGQTPMTESQAKALMRRP